MSAPSAVECVVAIGASAGGIEALSELLRALPSSLSAAFLVVVHIPAHSPSYLDEVLARCTAMPVRPASNGEPLKNRCVYVASADLHLMVDGGKAKLTRGPKECRVRPAIDVLFRSAAVNYGPRAAGVVLSGMLDDGTAGLWAIKEAGGLALVQDPAQAIHDSMPRSAIEHVAVDFVGPVEALAQQIVGFTKRGPAPGQQGGSPRHELENRIAGEENALQLGVMKMGEVSKYTCPDCHGVLMQVDEGRIVRFRCHTGHAFSIKTLLEEVSEAIDHGLWDTIRAVEERVLLLRQMGELARQRGAAEEATTCETQARNAEERIKTIRELVLDPEFFGRRT